MALPTLPLVGETRYSVRQAALSRATTATTPHHGRRSKSSWHRPDTPNARRDRGRFSSRICAHFMGWPVQQNSVSDQGELSAY